ncbi:NAD(P)/FAD-dependent oxidoreductase [Phenylobacterium sp.]|uniref:flavin-containing monooxygenase n=1 Tax=Phenylobacterium sp. TaxID=1871053 RepID=UPI00301CA1F0
MGELPQHDVVVIGAGFGGLYAVHRFAEQGFDVLGLEQAGDVGGVWYWNRYPGARCDCESYYYSYAFDETLQQDWTWSLRYSEQPEILRYLGHVADRFDLRRRYRFSTRVTAAHFDEALGGWRLRTADGFETTTRALVTAMGCLSQVNWPDIPGLRDFGGRLLHTAQWPHEPVDFAGRRVGVIGTGASAVQAIPRIAEQASQLTVFQRTANWVLPAWNRATDRDFDAWVKANYGEIRARCLASGGAVPFDPPERSALEVGDDERQAIYQGFWDQGGMRFFTAFTDLFTDEAANATAQAFVRAHIERTVRDPETARRLTPNDHPIGVKRPPLDDDYYGTFNRPNVALVDVRAAPIREVSGQVLRTAEAAYELDDLVVATGFDAITGALLALDVRGRGGVRLADRWAEGPKTYLGLGVAGFPNLFTVTGPLSPSVLANMPTAVEQHVDWIADCLDHMRARGVATLEATETAEAAWSAESDAAVAHTLYPKANSWYFGANIPGKPRRFGVYVGGFGAYRERCRQVAERGYEGFRLGAGPNG